MLTLGIDDELTEEEELVWHCSIICMSLLCWESTESRGASFRKEESCDLQKLELESVKRERRALMDSLAALKADQGKAGSERQMADIARLRRELESKQEKINELRQVCRVPQRRVVPLAAMVL